MKRVTIFSGHYGSGKTNIAVNYALSIKEQGKDVNVADLDIVNPYFRTEDSRDLLEKNGVYLICSPYANSNVDIPALPQEMYRITDDTACYSVVDLGGDDRGAYALGRLSPALKEENNFDMLAVINCYRPLSQDEASTEEILKEIETAGNLPFTGLVNNSNLGEQTTAEDVLKSVNYAENLSKETGLPLVMTTVKAELYEELKGKIHNLFPLTLQKKLF